MSITKGQTARQIVTPIVGVCTSKKFNEDTDSFECLIDYTDAHGEPAQRWFAEADLESVAAPDAAPAQ